jgi:Excalibur calcium-binding domain
MPSYERTIKRSAVLPAVAAAAMLATPANAAISTASPAADTAIPKPYKNCTQLNKRYPHGLGRAKARDKTSGDPVTTFKRSTRLYNVAMSHNRGLDRDKDGVACEQE